MANHKTLPFSHLHVSKLRTGAISLRPATPEALGDSYLATDTQVLYVTYDGTTWTAFNPAASSIPYNGIRWENSGAIVIAGTNVADYINLDVETWAHGESFGAAGSLILIPSLGIYRFSAGIKLQNTAAATWTFVVNSSDFDVLSTHQIAADGTGDPLEFVLSGEVKPQLAQPTTGAWFYINAAQDSGSNQNILAGSFISFSKIGTY